MASALSVVQVPDSQDEQLTHSEQHVVEVLNELEQLYQNTQAEDDDYDDENDEDSAADIDIDSEAEDAGIKKIIDAATVASQAVLQASADKSGRAELASLLRTVMEQLGRYGLSKGHDGCEE